MLQWMGGSRRKVTTTRKSTQKRQKQYFEQRKQQQQQQAADSEGYADETSIGGQNQKEFRSLDILSLLNHSTVLEEGKSCSGRRDGKALTMKYYVPRDPPTIITHSVPPPDSVVITEAGASSSGYHGGLQYPKVLFCSDDNDTMNGTKNSPDLCNAGAEKELSIFDMVSDGASEGSSERSLVHEAHVAFSIEGLGKIRTETPLSSPNQWGRISSDDCSLPWNVASQLNSSKSSSYILNDLDIEMVRPQPDLLSKDAMMHDINLPIGGNPSEFSMDMTSSHVNSNLKLSTITDRMQLDSDYINRKFSFPNTNAFDNIRRREDIWDTRISFLDDDFPNEMKDGVSCNYWPQKIVGDSGDLLEFGKNEMPDIALEGHHMLKKRDAKATKLNSLEHKASEIVRDYTTLIGLRHTPEPRYHCVGHLPGQPDWSCFGTEVATDNLSLLSEESCSSSAVTGETINSSLPKQSRRINNYFGSSRKKYDVDNVFAKKTHCKDMDNLGQQSRKCTRNPLPKSKAEKLISSSFQGETGTSETWLLEKGCNSVDIDLGFSSLHCISEAELPSLGCKLWTEDPIGSFPLSKINFDAKCFDRPKHGESIQCSPFGCCTSGKFAFCQPFDNTNSDDSPVLPKARSGSVKLDLSPDSRTQVAPLDSSLTAGTPKDTGFSDLSVQGSMDGDEKGKSKFQPANCEQFELGKENFLGNDLFYSEDPIPIDGSNPKNKDPEKKEGKTGTLKAKDSLKTCSPSNVEETSSSVKIHDKSESSTNDNGFNCDVEIPLPCQSGIEGLSAETRNAMLEEGKALRRRKSNGADSSKQVMRLESYVLQLLCVEKVVEDASTLDMDIKKKE